MMHHLGAQNGPFAPNKSFLGKIINTIFIYLLAPVIMQIFKKNINRGSRVLRMRHFWAQNGPFAQTRIFSEKLFINLFLSFIPNYIPKIKVRSQSIDEMHVFYE